MRNREPVAWQIIDEEVLREGFIRETVTDKPRVAQIWRDAGIKLRELYADDEEKAA